MARLTIEQIIAMLNDDLRGEHGAIIQYLRHAYAMGEGGVPCEVEAIAREEMYHFKWLAEMIVELGGKPTLQRAPIDYAGLTPSDWMYRDSILEQEAIDLYEKHIAAIDDPRVVRLLERIVADERTHKGQFIAFIEEVKQETPEEPSYGSSQPNVQDAGAQRAIEILNEGVRHEYTVILQYLWHSFLMPNCEVSRELEFSAINEMQHMGWLSEKVEGLGGTPATEPAEVNMSLDAVQMLKANIAAEQAVTQAYTEQIKELRDEGLKALLTRIRDHEIYHDAIFSELLSKLEQDKGGVSKTRPPADTSGKTPTIGSLMTS